MRPATLLFSMALLPALAASPCAAQGVVSAQDVERGNGRATLSIEVKVDAGPWKRRSSVSPLSTEEVKLRVKEVEGAKVRWFLVFPDLTRNYENANPPWEKDPYKWVGFDPIDYFRVELTEFEGQWEVAPFPSGRDIWAPVRKWFKDTRAVDVGQDIYRSDAGTFRFAATVTTGTRTLRTPGLEDIGDKGISTRVLSIARRDRPGYVGYVSAYYNVPGVFGSVVHQSNNHIGVDCADMLVAAFGHSKKRPVRKNYNVSMLVTTAPKVGTAGVNGGTPDKSLTWGKGLKAGDLIAVRYTGASRFQHIGVLLGDTDGDGILSKGDEVLHAGPHPIRRATLAAGSFDGTVVLLRPKKL